MSGIVGSRLNIRGSGLVGSLGTDGQVFTSSGAGVGAVFEAAAGGGKLLQSVLTTCETNQALSSHTTYVDLTGMTVDITPTDATSKLLVMAFMNAGLTGVSGEGGEGFFSQILRESTVISDGDTGVGYGSVYISAPGNVHMFDINCATDDGHDTTSAITIKVQGKTGADADSCQFNLNSAKQSYLLVQEIST